MINYKNLDLAIDSGYGRAWKLKGILGEGSNDLEIFLI
jgi:hypothetical protein